MHGWPPITEPLLRERQAMSDDEFFVHLAELLEAIGERELPGDHYERAIGYPWERPPGSCLVAEGEVRDIAPADGDLVDAYVTDAERIPLLAYGANASPGRLALKLAHLPEEHRSALILAARLPDFDVGAAAQPPVFSSMAATLIPSPGTRVRVAVLFLTEVQFTALWWTEHSYRLGALNDAAIACDAVGEPLARAFAFVSRYGAFCVDGSPVAMAAIPAQDRRQVAMTQLELLEAEARLLLGEQATALDLVREAYERPAAFMSRHRPALRAVSEPFRSERWEELPAAAP